MAMVSLPWVTVLSAPSEEVSADEVFFPSSAIVQALSRAVPANAVSAARRVRRKAISDAPKGQVPGRAS